MAKKAETKIAAHPVKSMKKPKASPKLVLELEDAAAAYGRVEGRALALSEKQFTAFNVDVAAAARIILVVITRLETYRARIAAELPRFDMRNVDELVDYAKAAWYATVSNVPEPSREEGFEVLLEEATTLRTHLLTWARPLAHDQKLEAAMVDRMKDRAAKKNVARDLEELVGLYRSNWGVVRSICGVTAEELDRGAVLSGALLDMMRRRDEKTAPFTDGSVNVRRFWTLADRAYDQCQRAIAFLEWGVADLNEIAPSLRRTRGRRSSPARTAHA
jgi:hypothetical protein